jgi:uroporphyrinogen decarboxylase
MKGDPVKARQAAAAADSAAYRQLPLSRMEEIIARFNERVDAAQRARPADRAWVIEAIQRRGGRRCPIRLKRLSLDAIVRYGDALADLFCEFPDDAIAFAPYDWSVGFQPASRRDRVNTVQALMKESTWVDEWGARWAHAADGVGAIQVEHPLKDWARLDEYLETRMPDPDGPGRLDEAVRQMAPHRGRKYAIGMQTLGILELLRNIRGMEEVFMDFHSAEDEVNRLMDALEAFLTKVLLNWAAVGADCVMFGDDWGMQTGLQISPDMWRRLFKHRYRRIFSAAHAAGIAIQFHSCGRVIDIVEDMIEVGVDILDPVQPGCMDVNELARRFGGRISFSGAVDIQGTMVFGRPADVRAEIHRLIATLGTPFGNGFFIGPANAMTPDIPLENMRAMVEACHEY